MDFIEGLAKSFEKDVILVVVDKFSKYSQFAALAHPFLVVDVAETYLDNFFKLHDWPQSTVSNKNKIFLSDLWQALMSV